MFGTMIGGTGRESLARRGINRLGWEQYQLRVAASRALWDVLALPTRTRIEQIGLVYSDCEPSILDDDPVVESMRHGDTIDTREYLYHLRHPVMIEPDSGYVIANPACVLDASLAGSDRVRRRSLRHEFTGLPRFSALAPARLRHARVRRERVVASLRYVYDANYYHLLVDLLTRLHLFGEHGVPEDIPLVVSPQLARTPYFQALTQRGRLAHRRWIVQDDCYILADEVIFAKTNPQRRDRLDFALDCVDAPHADTSHPRRLFITRSPARGRHLSNMTEVLPILDQFGLEVIDADEMTIEQQMTTFQQADLVVGLHGAGLTNILYRRGGPLRVLEIFPPHQQPIWYYMLAKMYGYAYDFLVGTQSDGVANTRVYAVNLDELRAKLTTLMRTVGDPSGTVSLR
jgi:capsular polysaccharide biosynthesis protein